MIVAVMITVVVEFLDFFLIGFVVSIVAPEWQLTFGQVSIVLLSAGVGAIIGSLVAGRFADHVGRKPLLLMGVIVFSLGTGAMALAPEGAWWWLSIMRFFVGAAVGALFTGSIPLILEFTPTRLRTPLGGITIVLLPLGGLFAALLGATLAPVIGWRGICLVAASPVILALWIWISVPESPMWLLSKGRVEQARRSVAYILKRPESELPTEVPPLPSAGQQFGYREVYRYRRAFWATIFVWFGATTAYYGVALWGPTILTLLLDVTPAQAAEAFIFVIMAGLIGRFVFVGLPQKIGRRKSGIIMGFGGAIFLAAAALLQSQFLGGVSLFLVFITAAALFADGGFVNIAAYFPELYPTELRSRSVGLCQAVNGVGKIAGPAVLGLIAGTSNLVTPEATEAAITPAFLFLAACSLLVGLTFVFTPMETHGKRLAVAGDIDEAAAESHS
jgi:putative MFS transporter